MGTDVHAVWQARKDGAWVDVASEWEQDRHYFLFSWLANVRNGFGFAGVPTYEPVQPIALPRGLPADFPQEEHEHATTIDAVDVRRREWLEDPQAPSIWLGDHSHSWLTADEILAAKRPGAIQKSGVVTLEQYRQWDGKSPPESYCGGIMGKEVFVAGHPSQIKPNTTHVCVEWVQPDDGLDYFVDEVRRLKTLHGDVRLVFGFDS